MDSILNTPKFDKLKVLVTLVESYKERCFIVAQASISAIKFRMDQKYLKQKDLIPIICDSTIVSKVLIDQRKLTVEMIKNLHKQLKIPFESLFGKMVINSYNNHKNNEKNLNRYVISYSL